MAAALVFSGLVSGQQQVWQLHGPADHRLGSEMTGIRDFNGDGVRDVLLSYQYYTAPYTPDLRVGIFSGADGSQLWWRSTYHRFLRDGGDMNGDGSGEFLAMVPTAIFTPGWVLWNAIEVRSPSLGGQLLWTAYGLSATNYAFDILGDVDTDGDGSPNIVTISRGYLPPPTYAHVGANVFVYNNRGKELYRLDMSALGFEPISLGKMGDLDGDGCDEFVVGCNDIGPARGAVHLISGRSGAILRTGYGLLPGDKTFFNATSVGDWDGDGVEDFAAFPWWSASRLMATAWSGATASVIRTIPEYGESVVASEDLDRDGVRDLVLGSDYPVLAPHIYGRVIAISGRDATPLWKVENDWGVYPSNAGWAWRSVGLGTRPGRGYPSLAWLDTNFVLAAQPIANATGRVRMFDSAYLAQGPVSGSPCASSGPMPLIGARATATGSRVTIAKGAPGAYAWLNLSLGNPTQYQGVALPLALDPFGLQGCQMHVGPDAAFFRQLGTTGIDRGYAAVNLPRYLSTYFGTMVQAQWLLYDPVSGWFGATEKHQLRFQ